jgi:beta-galactosidase
MRTWPLVLAMLILATALPLWAATTAEEVEEDLSLQSKLVTPHLDWGSPAAAGKLRGLFFIHGGGYGPDWTECGTRYREVVELCQRFDIIPEGALFDSGGGKWVFHGGKLGEDRAERLLAKPHDVIFIGGFALDKLPAKMQYEILKQVAEGAALVCCGGGPNEFMVAKRQIKPTPDALIAGLPPLPAQQPGSYLQPADAITAYKLGQGRGVWLKSGVFALTPGTGFTYRGLTEYEYWMLAIGRAAYWAAGKESPVAVKTILSDGDVRLGREDKALPGDVILSAAKDLTQAMPVTVQMSLRRAEDGLTYDLGKPSADLKANDTTPIPVILPRLRAGDYYLDVIVKSKRGVEAAAAKLLTIESPYGVSEVKLDSDYVERGSKIGGVVSTRGSLPAGARLVLRFRDSYNRVLTQQDLKVQAGQSDYPFSYTASPFETILMRPEAVVIANGQEVEMKSAEFTVPKRRHNQFNFVMWDGPNDVLGYYAWKHLQEVGYNTCLIGSMGATPRAQPPVLRACDTSLVPYSTRILDPKDESGYMKPVCWNHEPDVSAYVQKIVDNQVNLRQQGVFVYSLGDEGVTKGCCVHPSCLAAYRKWLTREYGTIERLNASWGEKYASFDEVNLKSNADNMELQARKTCPPRWYDREAFARYNLAQFSGRFGDRYKVLDPQGITGFEGTGNFGDDYDQIIAFNGFYGPYPSIGDDLVRSAAPRSLIRSNWMGYSKTGDALSDAAWRMIMKGLDSSWYWMWDGIGSYKGVISPTIDYFECTADFLNEMKPVREGLGDLLLNSQWAHSGIGIFYSLPSALAGGIENSGTYAQPQQTHETWLQMTYEVGQDARFITSAMLAKGALTNQEFKVLLLPMTQAMSPQEANLIRGFVRSGGTVIADVRPGIFDEHMKAVTPGLLDDVFGITRQGRGNAQQVDLDLKGVLGNETLDLKLPTKIDPDIRVSGAKALTTVGDVPIGVINQFGQGQAILLNCQLMAAKEESDTAMNARRLLAALYRFAGTQPLLGIASPQGQPLMATETRVWRNGDALVFGMWRQMRNAWFAPKSGTTAGEPVAARVTPTRGYTIYDLRSGKVIRQPRSFDTKLQWGRASFFLALPYQPNKLSLALAGAPQPGQPVTATIKLDIPAQAKEKFAVYVQVITPDGDNPLWGRQVVMLQSGQGQVQVPVAYNDQPGRWKLKATEVFTRLSAEATWTVK